MKNFIFISPNFPENYWKFCRELKNNGFRVLGIGDCPYDNLTYELKNSLHEYYRVNSLENYDEVYRAVAFFIFYRKQQRILARARRRITHRIQRRRFQKQGRQKNQT